MKFVDQFEFNNLYNSQIEKVYTINDDENKLTIIKFKEYGVESESVTLKFVPQHPRSLMDISDLTLKACFRPGKETYEISTYFHCTTWIYNIWSRAILLSFSTLWYQPSPPPFYFMAFIFQNKDTSTEMNYQS